MNAAFDGLNVLDLSNRFSGAFAARLFGDFGAHGCGTVGFSVVVVYEVLVSFVLAG